MEKIPYTEVGLNQVRGGVEVVAYNRSKRGTKFRQNSIVILTKGMSKAERKAAIAAAVLELAKVPA